MACVCDEGGGVMLNIRNISYKLSEVLYVVTCFVDDVCVFTFFLLFTFFLVKVLYVVTCIVDDVYSVSLI